MIVWHRLRLPIYPVFLLTLSALCLLAYLIGLNGDFLFDDFYNLVDNRSLQAIGTPAQDWLALALSSDAGILRRPVSMLTFGINVSLFGMNPFAFKLVNVGIHLLSGALVYVIGRRLAGRLVNPGIAANTVRPEALALVATGLWLLHPLHVSGVLYIVQRMNELSALFILAGLLCYVDGRLRMLRGEPAASKTILALSLFGLLAAASKENGALITAYALVIEAICFRFEAPQPRQRRIIQGFFWLSVALPLVLFVVYLATHPAWLSIGYGRRDFTLYERLLSEARILCDYLVWIFAPVPAWMGIFHDDIPKSTGFLNPVSTVFAIVFLITLAVAAWKLRRRSPGFAFGVAWFLIGQTMESTIVPLEIVFEHRNYLPMAGLLLGTVCAIGPWLASQLPRRALALGCTALMLSCAALTASRAAGWSDQLTFALTEAHHHPDSARAQYEAGRQLVIASNGNGDPRAESYFARSAMLDKEQIAPVTSLMLIEASRGEVAQFALDDLADRLRHTRNLTAGNAFLNMLIVASQSKLSLTPAYISSLVEATLANPQFAPITRAMIMNNYGAYLYNIVHDTKGAIGWTLAAAEENPGNPYFQLNLAKIAISIKQPGKAKEFLETAKQLDKLGLYNKELKDLERQLM